MLSAFNKEPRDLPAVPTEPSRSRSPRPPPSEPPEAAPASALASHRGAISRLNAMSPVWAQAAACCLGGWKFLTCRFDLWL